VVGCNVVTFTVHAPPGAVSVRDCSKEDLDRFRFIPERASFWAFVCPPLWLLFKGLWLAFFLWLIFMSSLGSLHSFAGSHQEYYLLSLISATLGWVFSIWFCLAARDVERWTLERRGWLLTGVVTARNVEEAQKLFFSTEL